MNRSSLQPSLSARRAITPILALATLACIAPAQVASFQTFSAPWQTQFSRFRWLSSDATSAVGTADSRVLRWSLQGGFEDHGPGEAYFGADHSSAMAGLTNNGDSTTTYFPESGPPEAACWRCYQPSGLSADGKRMYYVFDSTGGEGFISGYVYENKNSVLFAFDNIIGVSGSGNEAIGYMRLYPYDYIGPGYLRTDGVWSLNWGNWQMITAGAISRSGQVVAGLRRDAANTPTLLYTLHDNAQWHLHEWPAINGLTPSPYRVSNDGATILAMIDRAGSTSDSFYLWTRTQGRREIISLIEPLGILPDGWTFEHIADMTPDGRSFTGWGRGADGKQIAFIMTIPELCTADINWSWFVDTDDYDAFVALFIAGDPRADLDGTGFVDLDDFVKFVAAYEAGC